MLLKSKAVLPEGIESPLEVGDYTICMYEEDFYIIGTEVVESPLELTEWVKILPINGGVLMQMIEYGEVPDIYNLEDEGTYYLLKVEEESYLFDNAEDALTMLEFFIQLDVYITTEYV